ncbi:hypothetical protein P170DRAFT_444466 [Aspergillus steynii IBT 23096]|uniref:Tat pathway signal sequence domain protein n=1 Tax=Aspergillus steynii IBT 23096 TaxID=1392250 RepID=A0A2I2GHY8_9EURO|nr:uncharacterized protein P170DRAFT_444466 [Aspergillus steynii IBT 23096]PLB52492.1 hypothetical protein P170DRAFT_444466 [Aspergillus steynii IBT 23096]
MGSSETKTSLEWLGDCPGQARTTFGVPWPRGKYWSGETSFSINDESGNSTPLQSWTNAYWPDGSIKWTGHAISSGEHISGRLSIKATIREGHSSFPSGIQIQHDKSTKIINVATGKAKGNAVGSNGRLILLSQSDQSIDSEFHSSVEDVTIEQEGPIRAVIAIRGTHRLIESQELSTSRSWLPFILRFYFYLNSAEIRVAHTIIYDGDPHKTFIRGIGIRLDAPLGNELPYNRHVRFAGVENGIFSESVQGTTGLWKDPGQQIRSAQINGQALPPKQTWDNQVGEYMKWVPCWNEYTLAQLSPDGYTMKKRTAPGHSWVNIPGGTRAGGLAYLGGANHGGLAIGMRHFWERYPTSLDIRNANTPTGELTLWLYSPLAEKMDLRPHHDGLQQETYEHQLDALRVTYEDWEKGTGTPYGIARTNELSIFAFDQTPSSDQLSHTVKLMREPPVLVPDRGYILSTKALGTYWSPVNTVLTPTPSEAAIMHNLDFLFNFYKTQISERRWYGFWDHGDIMHTYDADRHAWRYDIGGYAWDNSELSPDLFFWLYFLQTGREDVYRLAEALTRHTSEVDAYHLGPWKGLGTRHGVQHWSDSCKQARVTSAIYKRVFYYVSGGDERTGELLNETLNADRPLLILDPYRKVRPDKSYIASADAVTISLGTDWSAFAAAWFTAWERRANNWEDAFQKLRLSMQGISNLRNGFVTGTVSYNINTGDILPPPHDPNNTGIVKVSHLSAMFGLFEVCAEVIDSFGDNLPSGFQSAWIDYCRFFNASADEQTARYGANFGSLILRQGHSRLTAYAARILHDASIARRAWGEFCTGDGYALEAPWKSQLVHGSHVPVPVQEAAWVSTNISALYGLAAIQNLALIRGHLPKTNADT